MALREPPRRLYQDMFYEDSEDTRNPLVENLALHMNNPTTRDLANPIYNAEYQELARQENKTCSQIMRVAYIEQERITRKSKERRSICGRHSSKQLSGSNGSRMTRNYIREI